MDDELERILDEVVGDMQKTRPEAAMDLDGPGPSTATMGVECPFIIPSEGRLLEVEVNGAAACVVQCAWFTFKTVPAGPATTLYVFEWSTEYAGARPPSWTVIDRLRQAVQLFPASLNEGSYKLCLQVPCVGGYSILWVPTWPAFWTTRTPPYQTLLDLWHQVLTHVENYPGTLEWLGASALFSPVTLDRLPLQLQVRQGEVRQRLGVEATTALVATETWTMEPPVLSKPEVKHLRDRPEEMHLDVAQTAMMVGDIALEQAMRASLETAEADVLLNLRSMWVEAGREDEYLKWAALADQDTRCPLCMHAYEDAMMVAQPCEHLSYCGPCWRRLIGEGSPLCKRCFRCGRTCDGHLDVGG